MARMKPPAGSGADQVRVRENERARRLGESPQSRDSRLKRKREEKIGAASRLHHASMRTFDSIGCCARSARRQNGKLFRPHCVCSRRLLCSLSAFASLLFCGPARAQAATHSPPPLPLPPRPPLPPAPAPAQPFVKVQKNKAYFKRYQVKWRRRRCECRESERGLCGGRGERGPAPASASGGPGRLRGGRECGCGGARCCCCHGGNNRAALLTPRRAAATGFARASGPLRPRAPQPAAPTTMRACAW